MCELTLRYTPELEALRTGQYPGQYSDAPGSAAVHHDAPPSPLRSFASPSAARSSLVGTLGTTPRPPEPPQQTLDPIAEEELQPEVLSAKANGKKRAENQ